MLDPGAIPTTAALKTNTGVVIGKYFCNVGKIFFVYKLTKLMALL
jgi:hypothetical protein